MRMRRKPYRGEHYRLGNGDEVTTLEAKEKMVKVLLPNGKTMAVAKDDLNLPIIDTKDYEKLPQ